MFVCRRLHYLLRHKWALLFSDRWLVIGRRLRRLRHEIPRQTSGSIRGSAKTDRQMEGSEAGEYEERGQKGVLITVASARVLSGCVLSKENTVPGNFVTAATDSRQVDL